MPLTCIPCGPLRTSSTSRKVLNSSAKAMSHDGGIVSARAQDGSNNSEPVSAANRAADQQHEQMRQCVRIQHGRRIGADAENEAPAKLSTPA